MAPSRAPSVSTPQNRSEQTAPQPEKAFSISLWAVIVSLVFINIVLVASVTVAVGSKGNSELTGESVSQASSSIQDLASRLQKAASREIVLHIEAYLTSNRDLLQAISSSIERGLVRINDWDKLVPFMKDTLAYIGPKANLHAAVIYSYYPNWNIFAIAPSYTAKNADGPATTDYIYSYWSQNATCTNFCPIRNTNNTLYQYPWNDTSYIIGPSVGTVPGVDFSAFGCPTDPRCPATRNGLIAQPDPYVSFGTISQSMMLPLFDSSPATIGITVTEFDSYNLCQLLNDAKNKSTANTLFYILTNNGHVLAMSGLNDQNEYYAALTTADIQTKGNNSFYDGTYRVKTMFEISARENPLLNLSSATIYEHAKRDLKSPFPDKQWYINGYLFQVTTMNFLGFQYIIVSGAPDIDYIGDTVLLEGRLKDLSAKYGRISIGSAAAIVVAMSLLSVTLTFFLIANPLRMVLTAMQKAVKFDFSAISDGSMKTRRSIVAEVGDIQEKFMELLTTFSKALKANKALVTGSRRVSSSTGNENNNDKAPLRRNEK